jgi:4-hydroxyphenylpyruvate dioxygenase
MRRSQLAINSITTRQGSFPEALDAYAAAGFTRVEFHLPLLKDWLAAGHSFDDARAALAQRGLTPIGGFQAGLEVFASPESKAANRALQLENARLIDALGGGTLVMGTDGPSTPPSIDDLPAIAAELKSLAGEIESLNVNLALEFNWGPVVKSLDSARRVCELADHPRVGILFDPAHYHCTPTKFSDISEQSVRWFKHVHLNDMADKPGELSNCNADRVLMGDGILDLHAIIGRIDELGYTGDYSIELFNDELWQLPAAETARRCYESLLPYCVD